MIILLVKQVLIMFLLVTIGYICFRTKKINLEGSRNIANILIYLSLPCVIINSFLVEFSTEKLLGLIYSSLFAAGIMIISIVVSKVFFGKDAILNFASSFSNPGFFGIPLIVATLSQNAVFYVAPFIAFVNLLQWTYGVSMLTKKETLPRENGVWMKNSPFLKRVITAPFFIAIMIGLFFFLTQIEMPELIYKTVQHISGLNTPLAMFTIGVYLAQTEFFKMVRNIKLYLLAFVRLIIIPMASLVVLFFVPSEFSEMKMALLIVAACPTGSNVATYAQLYENNYVYAVETVVISTLFSIVTLPLLVYVATEFVFL